MTENIEQAVTVSRNDAERRYEIHVGDALAGFTVFRPTAEGELIFPHTEIDPAFSGRGLASTLVGDAMADVAARGETVIPVCPFVVKYLATHEVASLKINERGGAA